MSHDHNTQWPHFCDRLVHDLREPSRSITSFTELLGEAARGRLGPECDMALQEVMEGATRIRTLIDGIARFSATLEPPVEEEEPSASLQLAFNIATLTLDRQIQDCRATVTAEGLPRVAVRLERLSLLMENLLANSLLFRGEEPPLMSVSAVPEGPDFWLIRVEDNGIGLDAGDCEAIFAPFMRVHGRKYPGAGMGLAICRNIVQNHGGRIWMEPGRDQGAVCSFTLPAAG